MFNYPFLLQFISALDICEKSPKELLLGAFRFAALGFGEGLGRLYRWSLVTGMIRRSTLDSCLRPRGQIIYSQRPACSITLFWCNGASFDFLAAQGDPPYRRLGGQILTTL